MKASVLLLAAVLTQPIEQSRAATHDDVRSVFDRFITAQNAHDISAVGNLLWNSPNFLWVTRGTPIWGRDAALRRFETLFQGTWRLSPDTSNLKVVFLTDTSAQLFVPVMFNIGAQGQSAPDAPFLLNQTFLKTAEGWRIASILPIPLPPPMPAPPR